MRAAKIFLIAAIAYVGIIVAFESMIGYFQPTAGATLTITTFEADGSKHDRVVSRLESDGKLYVAANHWPRAWYRRALENPDVHATIEGVTADYRAVRVTGAERDRVDAEHDLPFLFRVVTGFPPRHIVRLDPRSPEAAATAESAS